MLNVREGVVLPFDRTGRYDESRYQLLRFHGAYNNTELSITIPVTNSLAFLFTVLGEWWAENRAISRGACRVA
jgi:hypothetical protein